MTDQPNKTLFVNNIPYSATARELADHFNVFGFVHDSKILNETYHGKQVSRGMGFIIFENEESFKKALAAPEHILKNRRLYIQPARPKQPPKRDALFILGVPQGTTEEDVKAAFQGCTPLSVRIIRHNTETQRGFAFVQFQDSEARSNAIRANRTINLKGEKSLVRFARRDFNTRTNRSRRRRFRRYGNGRRAPRRT